MVSLKVTLVNTFLGCQWPDNTFFPQSFWKQLYKLGGIELCDESYLSVDYQQHPDMITKGTIVISVLC